MLDFQLNFNQMNAPISLLLYGFGLALLEPMKHRRGCTRVLPIAGQLAWAFFVSLQDVVH